MISAVHETASPIRLLDVRRDLFEVADLIDLCFSSQMDAEGRDYIRYIRRVAHNRSLIRWIPGAAERVSMPLHGYVWEEDGVIIGNLTLIPFYSAGKWLYLIANVAVHPDFRRRGIGRQLTQRAIEHIRQHQVDEAWLQVRDDNPGAIELYRSLGFVEQVRRTTWQGNAVPVRGPVETDPQIDVTRRHSVDWPLQTRWLEEIYPAQVSWNLSFDWRRLRPGFLRAVSAWINGETFEHWAARLQGRLIGTATWEPGRGLSDMIWLGVDAAWEEQAVYALLAYIRSLRLTNRYLSINYPAGRAASAFTRSGFNQVNTLIWMKMAF